MHIDLSGKTAIISGSIQGIGKQIAFTLAEAGAAIVINSRRDKAGLQKVAEQIIQKGFQAKAVIADVSKKTEAQKLVDVALQFGSVDILVNNAGGLVQRLPVAEFNAEHFQTVMDMNVKSSFLMAHLVLEVMKKQKSGKIINMSSQAAHDGGGPGAAVYAASKGAVWTFTKSLAKEAASHGITVNCISPGFIVETNFHNTFTAKEIHEQMPSKIPLGRNGTPLDVVNVVLFLASSLSDYMTGQSLEVNGGLYMP